MKSLVTIQLPKDLYILYKAAEFYENFLTTARWLTDYWTALFDSKSNGRQDNIEHMISEEAAHHVGAA